MIVLGIDPGLSGGLAIIAGPSSRPRILEAIDVPRDEDGIDPDAVIAFIQRNPPDRVVLERVRAMPSIPELQPDGSMGERRTMGAQSSFNFGGAYHSLRVIVIGLGYRPHKVEAATWKRAIGIHSKDQATGIKRSPREIKELGRQKALARFPNGKLFFPNIGNHNKAEASLIALFGLYYFAGDAVQPRPWRSGDSGDDQT